MFRKKILVGALLIFGGLFFYSDSYGLNIDLSKKLDYVPREVLISFLPQISHHQTQAFFKKYNLKEIDSIQQLNIYRAEINDGKTVFEKINEIFQDKRVKYCQPNWLYKLNRTISKLEELQNQPAYQTTHLKEAIEFMRSLGLDYSKIMVVVVDTGIKKDHEFFSPDDFYDPGKDFITDFVDIHLPLDYRIPGEDYKDPDNNPEDHVGHGTHVAGIVKTITDGKIKIWPFRAGFYPRFLSEFAIAESIVSAVDEATKQGVRLVFNFSFGRDEPNVLRYATLEAIKYAQKKGHSVFVAAAGNDGIMKINFPASLDEVIAVGAIDNLRRVAKFSNIGAKVIYAPGVKINSSTLKGFEEWSGTSMSTPFVSGLIANSLVIDPELSDQELKILLRKGTTLLNPFYSKGKRQETKPANPLFGEYETQAWPASGYMGRQVDAYKFITSVYTYSKFKKLMFYLDEKVRTALNRLVEPGERKIMEDRFLQGINDILKDLVNKELISKDKDIKEEISQIVQAFWNEKITQIDAQENVLVKLWESSKNEQMANAISTFLKVEDSNDKVSEKIIRENIKDALEILAKTDFSSGLNYLKVNKNINTIIPILSNLTSEDIVRIITKLMWKEDGYFDKQNLPLVDKIIEKIEKKNPLLSELIKTAKILLDDKFDRDIIESRAIDVKKLENMEIEALGYIFNLGNPEEAYKLLEDDISTHKASQLLSSVSDEIAIVLLRKLKDALPLSLFRSDFGEVQRVKEIIKGISEEKLTSIIEKGLKVSDFPLHFIVNSLSPQSFANIIQNMSYKNLIEILGRVWRYTSEDIKYNIEDLIKYLEDIDYLKADIIKVWIDYRKKEINESDITRLNLINKELGPEFTAYFISKLLSPSILNDIFDKFDLEDTVSILISLIKSKDYDLEAAVSLFQIKLENGEEKLASILTQKLPLGVNIIKAILEKEKNFEKDIKNMDPAYYYVRRQEMAKFLFKVLAAIPLNKATGVISNLDFEEIVRALGKMKGEEELKLINDISIQLQNIDKMKANFTQAIYLAKLILQEQNGNAIKKFKGIISQYTPEIASYLMEIHPLVSKLIYEKMGAHFTYQSIKYLADRIFKFWYGFFYLAPGQQMGEKWLERIDKETILNLINELNIEESAKLLELTYSTLNIHNIFKEGIQNERISSTRVAKLLAKFGEKYLRDMVDIIWNFFGRSLGETDYTISDENLEILEKIARALENINHPDKASLIKLMILLSRKSKEEVEDSDLRDVKTVFENLGPQIIAYILDINLKNSAGLLELLPLQQRADILKFSPSLVEILLMMNKDKSTETMEALGPDVIINNLNKLNESYVVKFFKWLYKLNVPIAREVIEKITDIDSRWQLVLDMLDSLKLGQEITDKTVQLFIEISERFKPESVWYMIRDEDSTKVANLFTRLILENNMMQFIATMIWNTYLKIHSSLFRATEAEFLTNIILEMHPQTVADLFATIDKFYLETRYGGIEGEYLVEDISPQMWLKIYEKGKKKWINDFMSRFLEIFDILHSKNLPVGIIKNVLLYLYASDELKFKALEIINILEEENLIKILEKTSHFGFLDEVAAVIEMLSGLWNWKGDLSGDAKPVFDGAYKPEKAVSLLLKLKPETTLKIINELLSWTQMDEFRIREISDWIVGIAKRDRIFGKRIVEIASQKNQIKKFMHIALYVTNPEKVEPSIQEIKLIEEIYNYPDYVRQLVYIDVLTHILERGEPSLVAKLVESIYTNTDIDGKLAWDLLRTMGANMYKIFNEMEQTNVIGLITDLVNDFKSSPRQMENVLKVADELVDINPQLSNEILKILYDETTITINGTLKDIESPSDEPIKVEAYIITTGEKNTVFTKVYKTYVDSNGNYSLRIPILTEPKETWKGLLGSHYYGDTYTIVVKAKNYPHLRIIDIPREEALKNLLGGNIEINFGDHMSQEELNRRVIIEGKVIDPITKKAQSNIKIKVSIITLNTTFEETLSTPVQITTSDSQGNYRIEIPTWPVFRNAKYWDSYKILVDIEGYQPIEIEIPAEEADEKLFGQVITIPPPLAVDEESLPPETDVDIAVSQDSFSPEATFTPSGNSSYPYENPFSIW